MVQLMSMREADTIIPEDFRPIYWPPPGSRCFAIIFLRPEGGVVMPSLASSIRKIDRD